MFVADGSVAGESATQKPDKLQHTKSSKATVADKGLTSSPFDQPKRLKQRKKE